MTRGSGAVWAGAALAAALPLFALQEQRPEPERGAAYVRRLYETDRATFGDACRGMASLAADAHTDLGFGELLGDLVARGIVDERWDLDERSPVTRATLAYMIARALDLRGGLTMSIFGASRRYAFRECVYLGIVPPGPPGEFVSGRELIDVLTYAEIYRREGSLDSLRK